MMTLLCRTYALDKDDLNTAVLESGVILIRITPENVENTVKKNC